jgi:beta-lactamase regulating signal transducer with metallopeptidase domain
MTLLLLLIIKPALIVCAAAAAAIVLRRHSAATRHAVWLCALLATIVLPILHVALPPLRLPLPERAVDLMGLEVPGESLQSWRAETAGAQPLTDATPARRRTVLPWFAALWLAGVLGLGLRRVRVEAQVRQLVRAGRPLSSAHQLHLHGIIARRSGVDRPVAVHLCADVATPAVTGITHPVIVLPADAETWAPADFSAVLVHELGHVARGDSLFNLCADVAGIIYWCNPLIHIAVRRMRVESERACDDRVLQCGADADEYAQLLVDFARAARAHAALPAAATAIVRQHQLEARVIAVLDAHTRRDPLRARNVMTLAVCTALLTLAGAAATLTAQQSILPLARPTRPEPDRAGDALAAPQSERLPLRAQAFDIPRSALEHLRGADATLAAAFLAATTQPPQHEADLVAERAAWALSRIDERGLIAPLLDALHDDDWRAQAYAAWALAYSHDRRAVPPLIALLDHAVWRVRAMAAFALAQSHDPRAAPAMRAALSDPAWQVRLQGVHFFAAAAEPAAVITPLLDDRHIAVRRAAADALITR